MGEHETSCRLVAAALVSGRPSTVTSAQAWYGDPMSGSGPGYTPGGPPTGDCDIVEKTPLNSPKSAVLTQLKKGDVLAVQASPDGRSIVAAKDGVGVAGSLTPRRLADLLECLEKGRKYKATIVELRGAFCEVEIRPN